MDFAGVYYKPNFLEKYEADALLRRLFEQVKWKQEFSTVAGRKYKQARLTAWYGEEALHYSGIDNKPKPWLDVLSNLRGSLESATGATYNGVLLNFYRNGDDSIGVHSDNERELGARPVIASVSLGATRTFVLAEKKQFGDRTWRLPLEHGSLLVMHDDAQARYVHHVPKEPSVTEPRVNLTYRRVFPELRVTR